MKITSLLASGAPSNQTIMLSAYLKRNSSGSSSDGKKDHLTAHYELRDRPTTKRLSWRMPFLSGMATPDCTL